MSPPIPPPVNESNKLGMYQSVRVRDTYPYFEPFFRRTFVKAVMAQSRNSVRTGKWRVNVKILRRDHLTNVYICLLRDIVEGPMTTHNRHCNFLTLIGFTG